MSLRISHKVLSPILTVGMVLTSALSWDVGAAFADTNEVQTITASSASGSASITVPATSNGSGGTLTIVGGDSAATVQSNLEAIASIGSGNVSVSGSTTSSGGGYVISGAGYADANGTYVDQGVNSIGPDGPFTDPDNHHYYKNENDNYLYFQDPSYGTGWAISWVHGGYPPFYTNSSSNILDPYTSPGGLHDPAPTVSAGGSYSGTYTVTFQGTLAGVNIDQLTTSSSGWTTGTTTDGATSGGGGGGGGGAAGQLKSVKVTPTSTTEGTAGTTFNITLTAPSSTSVKSWKFLFATTPSDAGGSNVITTGAIKPTNFAISGTPTATVTKGGSADANFSVASTVTSGNIMTLTASSAEAPGGANTAWTFALPGITLPHVGDCSGNSSANTDTCYVRIVSTSDGTTFIDQAVASFTFTKSITVNATVDAFMTFSVTGITANFSNYDSNIDPVAHPALGTAVTATTGTNIPFGNLTVGADKFAMQQIDVRTNASAGYKVYHKMTTASNRVLIGTFGSPLNHIDPFGSGSSWDGSGTPTATAWTEPTGLPNAESGWLGLQTAGNTGNGTIGANWVGPVTNNNGTGGIVKSKSGPDNGVTGSSGNPATDPAAGTSAYVTFRVSVDAYQPADSYTGTMEYNVVANY